ncbi:hypothetical protein A3L09_10115 [Thermococcus profundus]|uniref:Uncharacterized protein n=1 Tax=Thermococcus profundus TaxID=49899 RepID=A0A2Z2MFT5_THEPR|nr:hypothetical protein [Thermococcus profundus]ASJ03585.1 hypothetical protein A3L09_10115 [Thermococcus profundus]
MKKLLIVGVMCLFITLSAYLNLTYEITSGGFPGKVVTFIYTNFQNYHYSFSLVDKGSVVILTVLSELLSESPEHILLFPFGIFFTSLGYYVLFKEIFNSTKIGFFFLVYALIGGLASGDQIGAYAGAWVFILLALFILFLYKYTLDSENHKFVVIVYFLYVGLFMYWHTPEAIALFFFTSLVVVLIIVSLMTKMDHKKEINGKYIFVYISMLVTTLSFKELLFTKGGYISQISLSTFVRSYTDWIHLVAVRLRLINVNTKLSNSFYYTPSSKLATVSTVADSILILFIIFPVIVSYIVDIKILISKDYSFTRLLVLKWSLISTQVLLTIFYGLTGGAGPGITTTLFPIASVISILEIKHYLKWEMFKNLLTLYLAVLLILNTLGVVYPVVDKVEHPGLKYIDLATSAYWFSEKLSAKEIASKGVLTDFKTATKVSTLLAKRNIQFNYICFTPEYYQVLSGDYHKIKKFSDSGSLKEFRYVLVDIKYIKKPVEVDQGWIPLKPIATIMGKLNFNHNLNKIYDNRLIVMYHHINC